MPRPPSQLRALLRNGSVARSRANDVDDITFDTLPATALLAPAPASAVAVSLANGSLVTGHTTQATAVVTDATGDVLTGRVIAWSVDAHATISPTGLVTATSLGDATVTGTVEGVSGTAALSVTLPVVATVTVTLAASTLTVGQTAQATAVVRDASGTVLTGRTIAWTVSAHASITSGGLVTATSSGAVTVTATVETVVGTASATVAADAGTTTLVVPLTLFRNDGLTGATRATQGVPLPVPGATAIHAGDLATAAMYDPSGTEVRCYLEDLGARHLGLGDDTALHKVHTEVDHTWADTNDLPTYELRFDPTHTPLPRLTKQGCVRFTDNVIDVGLSADGKKVRVLSPCTYWHGRLNTVVRHAAADVDFDLPFFIPATITPGAGDGFRFFKAGIIADQTGHLTLRAIDGGPYATASRLDAWVGFGSGVAIDINHGEQLLASVLIFVQEGHSYSYGTDRLDATGVTLTTTAGTYKPYSQLPNHVQRAGITPSSVDYRCDSLFGGMPLAPQTEWAALPANIRAFPDMVVNYSDYMYCRGGYDFTTDAITGQYTTYAPSLCEWRIYATTGNLRNMRRALLADRSLVDKYTANGWSLNEPNADFAGHLFTYLLTGDDTNLTHIADVATGCEHARLGISGGIGVPYFYTGSGRYMKHLIHGLAWAATAGVDLNALAAAYALTDSDVLQQDWPNKLTYRSVTSNHDRWLRAVDFQDHCMLTTATGRYLSLSDYSLVTDGVSPQGTHHSNPNWGLGAFMQGFSMSEMVFGMRVYGTPAIAITSMRDSEEYLFTGLSPIDGVTPMYGATQFFVDHWGLSGTDGLESFPNYPMNYFNTDEPISAPPGANPPPFDPLLNPIHHTALAYLGALDGATKWKARGDALLKVALTANINSQWPYAFSKTTSELGLHSLGWPRQRALIP